MELREEVSSPAHTAALQPFTPQHTWSPNQGTVEIWQRSHCLCLVLDLQLCLAPYGAGSPALTLCAAGSPALFGVVWCWISSCVGRCLVLDPQLVMLVPREGAHDGDLREGSACPHSLGSRTTKGACHEYSFISSLKGKFAFGTGKLSVCTPTRVCGDREAEPAWCSSPRALLRPHPEFICRNCSSANSLRNCRPLLGDLQTITDDSSGPGESFPRSFGVIESGLTSAHQRG